MATFNTKKVIPASPALINTMGERLIQQFTAEGFEAQGTALSNGGYDVSITKGGTFKAVLGMKSALKVNLTPQSGAILFDAGVGIFGQQAIPTVISMLFFWPVLITQIWGIVEQAKLDDKALEICESVVLASQSYSNTSRDADSSLYCTGCGNTLSPSARFCPNCGKKV